LSGGRPSVRSGSSPLPRTRTLEHGELRTRTSPLCGGWLQLSRGSRNHVDGIVLVGGGPDEAPEVYKRLPEVLAAHGATIRVKQRLKPIGVAMAARRAAVPVNIRDESGRSSRAFS
jgi:hypothetical protein